MFGRPLLPLVGVSTPGSHIVVRCQYLNRFEIDVTLTSELIKINIGDDRCDDSTFTSVFFSLSHLNFMTHLMLVKYNNQKECNIKMCSGSY